MKKYPQILFLNQTIPANWCTIGQINKCLRSLEENPDLELSKNKLQPALVNLSYCC